MDSADLLTELAVEGKDFFYKQLAEIMSYDTSVIRPLELAYLATAVTSFIYLRFGRQPDKEKILTNFTRDTLSKSLPSESNVSFAKVAKDYEARLQEYNTLLTRLFNPGESKRPHAPETILLMRAYGHITGLDTRDHYLQILLCSVTLQRFIQRYVDFVNEHL